MNLLEMGPHPVFQVWNYNFKDTVNSKAFVDGFAFPQQWTVNCPLLRTVQWTVNLRKLRSTTTRYYPFITALLIIFKHFSTVKE